MLAINTAFMTANLALKTPEGKVYLKDIDAKSKHSENVLKTIEDLCEQANINVLDVQTVAVVVGPGSFTGLRIGTAIAKALGAVNKDLKFVGLSSLELMAYIARKRKLTKDNFVCVLNALSNLYFVAYFDVNGIKLQEEKMIDAEEFSKIAEEKIVLNGDLSLNDAQSVEITPEDLLEFALSKEQEKQFVEEKNLVPVYLRLSQAEDNLEKKIKKDKN